MIIAGGAISLIIQEMLYRADPGLFGDKINNHSQEN